MAHDLCLLYHLKEQSFYVLAARKQNDLFPDLGLQYIDGFGSDRPKFEFSCKKGKTNLHSVIWKLVKKLPQLTQKYSQTLQICDTNMAG